MHIGTFFASLWIAFISIFGFGHATHSAPQAALHVATTSTPTQASQSTSSPVATSHTSSTATSKNSAATQGVAAHYASFTIHAIPLGDGKVSTSPKVGYVYSCVTTFKGGGAMHSGDWIQGNTWDLSKKLAVQGTHYWKDATFSDTVSNAIRSLRGNGLPVNTPTGTFPIQPSDPASAYDRNPNSVGAYTVSYSLPANPTFAAKPSCLPLGPIGYALNGVAIFDALDASGRDAVAHEIQDSCDGHPQGNDIYHYHGPSTCMPNIDKPNTVVGFALDGFPITSMFDAKHHYYTNADLDACHGMTSTITFPDGSTKDVYHYVLTQEYPYTLGCFMGTPVSAHANGGTQQTNTSTGKSGPPQAAINACASSTSGAACSFSTPKGTVSGTCKMPPNQNTLACVPQ